jgi:hypothetical protein
LDTPSVHGDCGRCAALCCLALAFDRSPLFAFDKPAGVGCAHLDARHRCAIHSERERRGFRGCATYDCLGAGQRVTQEAFGGRSWRDDRTLIAPMMDAFWVLRQAHESWLWLRQCDRLHHSGRLALTPAQRARRRELEHALQPTGGRALAEIRAFEHALGGEVAAFLLSVRAHNRAESRPGEPRAPRRLRVYADEAPRVPLSEPCQSAAKQ